MGMFNTRGKPPPSGLPGGFRPPEFRMAYFVIELRASRPGEVPSIVSAGIYSEKSPTTRIGETTVQAVVAEARGADYGEASYELKRMVYEEPRFAWARKWVIG